MHKDRKCLVRAIKHQEDNEQVKQDARTGEDEIAKLEKVKKLNNT